MSIINLNDYQSRSDEFHDYDPTNNPVLVIDNGSFKCRAGWSNNSKPLLEFRSIISKPRKDRRKDIPDSSANKISQVGNDIGNIESVRLNLKTQFDRNVVTHFYNQEQIFDYIFNHLSVSTEEKFSHPILMTEAIGNPNYFRQQMNELLFECYGVPSVCYGIDSLFSWQRNGAGVDAFIISFGYHTTHIVPVLDNCMQIDHVRRLNLGGYHIIYYLYRLMQMKYPMHLNAITISRMETLLHCHSNVAFDYLHELKLWSEIDFYNENVKKIQLAFVPPTQGTVLTADQKNEKRKELTRRLLEINSRRAKNKQVQLQNQLQTMSNILALYENEELEKFESELKNNKIDNLEMLNKVIDSLNDRLNQMSSTSQDSPATNNRPQKEKNSNSAKPPADVPIEKWLSDVNNKRLEILRRKDVRKARRQDQAKRHTAAAQERMRIISLLANNDKGVDTFGINDNDWDVYKSINRDNESDSDSDNEKLMECENILRQHDPSFKQSSPQPSDTAENYQLHFSVESIRAPELLFQPSLIGSSEMGLAELIDFVLKLFSSEHQQRMVNNILLTGGCSLFAGLQDRLHKEFREIRPFNSAFNICKAQCPDLDAWLGARDFASSTDFNNYLTTRNDYDEKGFEYLREHITSNVYTPTPQQ